MKLKGVTDCILHFSVLNTRSSILCIVLASNTNLESHTCLVFKQNQKKKKKSVTDVNMGLLNLCHFIYVYILLDLTCKSRESGTSVSSILAARDKHATANNCIVQDLPFYIHIRKERH